jgi:hypothetical protein
MTITKREKFPKHLCGLIIAHNDESERLRIGQNVLTNIDIQESKKRKLALRDAILAKCLDGTGPEVTDSVLHPLSRETLVLLEDKLRVGILDLKTRVGPTAFKLRKLEALHVKVLTRLKSRGLELDSLPDEVQIEMPLQRVASG